ncbi:hypothetical protein KR009_011007 [Drosophila setifemur]|nr:hypothetical protein KR009_011007 [Drosophila setifemur]
MAKKPKDSDSDSDSEDDAQMRQFLEAADTTLLTNAMFQGNSKATDTKEEQHVVSKSAEPAPAKSERYLEEQELHSNDLHVTREMQTHVWNRLSGVIQGQIEFCDPKPHPPQQLDSFPDRVKLVANADCFLSADVVVEGPPGPQRRPTIKRRTPKEEQSPPEQQLDLSAIVVSGESILEGKDLLFWAEKKPRPDKFFQYWSHDTQGLKLVAKDRVNEFTKRRRQNQWNESKIAKKQKNK